MKAEARGWLPVGAVVTHRGAIVAEGCSQVPGPPYHPGRHAEVVALGSLPPYYDGGGVPEWIGPIDPKRCDPLYHRCDAAFAMLPVGRAL